MSESTSVALSPLLDGDWSLEFTTEESVRKIVQGIAIQSISQQIDLE